MYPRVLGGSLNPEIFTISFLVNFGYNKNPKKFIGCIWGKDGLLGKERGLVAIRLILTLKKGTRNSDLQSSEPPLKFLLSSLP